jgi:hypothetical protein
MTNQNNLRILLAHFSSYDQAKQACQSLQDLGISSDQIAINSDEKVAAAGSGLLQEKDESDKSTFSKWWDSLFGSDDREKHAERSKYETAIAQGSTVLRAVVPASTEDSAMRILNSAGATDIDQAASGTGGVRAYDHPAPASTGKIRATGLSPHPITPGVQSNGAGTAGAGTLAGNATASSALDSFSPEYGRHFETSMGGDNDFGALQPAYDYGYSQGGETRYQGRTWDEIEADLRAGYEQHYPETDWEAARTAVHQGWDKYSDKR